MSDQKTFAAFAQSERNRLAKEREKLQKKQDEVQEQIDKVDAELRAIDAYEAVKSGKPVPGTTAGSRRTGTRRSGIRDDVQKLISTTAGGLTRGELLQRKGIESDDKSGAQAISNALAALKKAGKIKQGDGGKYLPA